MSKFINLTPHAIVLEGACSSLTIEPSGDTLRIPMKKEQKGEAGGFPIYTQQPDLSKVNLPATKPNTYYIVSSIVLAALKQAAPHRQDFLAPDTGAAKRNEKGHIVSVPGFVQ